jgi:ankyrin repeat protein
MSTTADRFVDGRTDLVFELVAGGSLAAATDVHGTPLIRWCAYYGDVSALRFLVKQGEALETLGPNFDLNGAAFHGHWQLCQFLIENGADVNHALPDTGETPLHAALCKAMRQRFDNVVRVLLSAGANPNSPTTPGIETGAFMRDVRTRGETPLHRAAAFGTAAAVRMLLDAGANVEARDIHGETPLAWASLHLRQATVLDMLCFGQHRIHPDAVANDRSDHGSGFGGMDEYLLGKPHTP